MGALIIPKIEYLRILLEHLHEFDVAREEPASTSQESDDAVPPDLPQPAMEIDKLTIVQLAKMMTVGQIAKILGTIFALDSGAFYLGMNTHAWNIERENNALSNQVQTLKTDYDKVIVQRDSLAQIARKVQKSRD